MVASINSSTAAQWSNALFSKLDTKNQGYIDKAQIQAAFTSTGTADTAAADGEAADKLFAALDVDGDSKVTKSELSSAIDKLTTELNAQLDQSRVEQGKGGARPSGPPPGGGSGGPGPSGGTAPASSEDSERYVAAADLDGDGTVSAEEAAAYKKQQAAAQADTGLSKEALTEQLGKSTDARQTNALTKLVDNFDKADANGDGKLTRDEGRDYLKSNRPNGAANEEQGARGLARALELLKAYVDKQEPASTVTTSA